jgi:hypothetical protein
MDVRLQAVWPGVGTKTFTETRLINYTDPLWVPTVRRYLE